MPALITLREETKVLPICEYARHTLASTLVPAVPLGNQLPFSLTSSRSLHKSSYWRRSFLTTPLKFQALLILLIFLFVFIFFLFSVYHLSDYIFYFCILFIVHLPLECQPQEGRASGLSYCGIPMPRREQAHRDAPYLL